MRTLSHKAGRTVLSLAEQEATLFVGKTLTGELTVREAKRPDHHERPERRLMQLPLGPPGRVREFPSAGKSRR